MGENMTFEEMIELIENSNNHSHKTTNFKPPNREEIIESMAKYMLENTDIAEIENKFADIGVNVKHENGTYKNLIDVLKETSEVFNRY